LGAEEIGKARIAGSFLEGQGSETREIARGVEQVRPEEAKKGKRGRQKKAASGKRSVSYRKRTAHLTPTRVSEMTEA